MERTELTTSELNAKLNSIFNKVKESCKILEVENAEKMIGKRIMAFQEDSDAPNQEWIDEFDVVGITNEFEMAKNKPYDNSKFANFAEYWESYMDAEQIEERKSNLRLLVKNNINPTTTKVGWFPIDSDSMFDDNVFFTEI
jgi:hypothetical protein